MFDKLLIVNILSRAGFMGEKPATERKYMGISKPDTRRDLEALIAVTKKNRAQLQKTWKKIAELKAAIQSVKNGDHRPENKN
jgi:hypothetical protein